MLCVFEQQLEINQKQLILYSNLVILYQFN